MSVNLDALRDAVGRDPGGRGLATDPADNLLTAHPTDFAAACHSLADTPNAHLLVVTGFHIPSAGCGETDGPPGALFLARTLPTLGVRVTLASDDAGFAALRAGVEMLGLAGVEVVPLPLAETRSPVTHLLALERVGPAHTLESVASQPGATAADVARFVAEVPPADHDRCHTMRGRDITAVTADAWTPFLRPANDRPVTLGIGDGGNEIGMGKVRWETIRRNVPGGGRVACRVPADYLIVAGISNWGAYALAAGVGLAAGRPLSAVRFDPDGERDLLRRLVAAVPLVDGVTGERTATVDGLSWEAYAAVIADVGRLAGG